MCSQKIFLRVVTNFLIQHSLFFAVINNCFTFIVNTGFLESLVIQIYFTLAYHIYIYIYKCTSKCMIESNYKKYYS